MSPGRRRGGTGGPQVVPRPGGTRPGRPARFLGRRVTAGAVAEWAGRRPGAGRTPAGQTIPLDRPPARSPIGELSAVLVPLVVADSVDVSPDVLLTRRSPALRRHPGEVAFPGGRLDGGEDWVTAALREAGEEIGLPATAVQVLGSLPGQRTRAQTHVVPVVGRLRPPVRLRPNAAEVAAVFVVALDDLARPGVHHEELWPTPRGGFRAIHFFDLDGETVWGATAAILYDLLLMLTDDRGS